MMTDDRHDCGRWPACAVNTRCAGCPERQADEDIAAGRVTRFADSGDALAWLADDGRPVTAAREPLTPALADEAQSLSERLAGTRLYVRKP